MIAHPPTARALRIGLPLSRDEGSASRSGHAISTSSNFPTSLLRSVGLTLASENRGADSGYGRLHGALDEALNLPGLRCRDCWT